MFIEKKSAYKLNLSLLAFGQPGRSFSKLYSSKAGLDVRQKDTSQIHPLECIQK